MSTATMIDPLTAWALASRDEELDRYRQWYAERYPAPAPEDIQEASITS